MQHSLILDVFWQDLPMCDEEHKVFMISFSFSLQNDNLSKRIVVFALDSLLQKLSCDDFTFVYSTI